MLGVKQVYMTQFRMLADKYIDESQLVEHRLGLTIDSADLALWDNPTIVLSTGGVQYIVNPHKTVAKDDLQWVEVLA